MSPDELVVFVRARRLGVVATTGPDGHPEAALVGIAATEECELVFDTSARSRKHDNLVRDPRVAVVVGWDDEVTLQIEGVADKPTDADRDRCLTAYFAQYPDGRQRAEDPDITHFRIRPRWARRADFRPGTFGVEELALPGPDIAP